MNGKDAIKKLKLSCANFAPYKIVFLDMNMPVMNGI